MWEESKRPLVEESGMMVGVVLKQCAHETIINSIINYCNTMKMGEIKIKMVMGFK